MESRSESSRERERDDGVTERQRGRERGERWNEVFSTDVSTLMCETSQKEGKSNSFRAADWQCS